MQTNASITFYRRVRNWKQEITDPEEIGTYDVWLEFGSKVVWRSIGDRHSVGGQGVAEEIGKGMIFLLDDVDLTDAYFAYKGEQYEVSAIDGDFLDRQQNFHHKEVLFK
jgi:hypothetical protein